MTTKAQHNARKFQATPLSLRAEVGSINEEARTVELIWSTGAKVLRSSWYDGPYWEELSMDPAHVRLERLNNSAPLLDSHAAYSVLDVLGTVVAGSARLADGNGYATVRVPTAEQAGGDPRAEQVWQRLKSGFIKNVSVGYRTYKAERTESADGSAPTLKAIDWEPYEISLVPMGADDGAKVRGAQPSHEVEVISRGISPFKERSMTPEELKAQQEELAKREAAIKAREMEMAEEKRKAEITALVARAAKREGFNAELGKKLIDDKTSLEGARAAILDELVRLDSATEINNKHEASIEVGETDGEKFARGAINAIISRGGKRGVLEAARAKKLPGFEASTEPGEQRRLIEIATASLERRGIKTRGRTEHELMGQALAMGRRDGGSAGSTDFPVLVSMAAERVLLASYALQPHVWQRIVKVEEVANFKNSDRLRAGALPNLKPVNEHGEFQTVSFTDGEKISIKTSSKGVIVRLTRELLINDDLGAFLDRFDKAGIAADRTIEDAVFALLATNSGAGPTQSDTQPFFHANRKNLGAASALTADGVAADITLLANQQDNDGQYIGLAPAVLVVGSSQWMKARILNTDAQDPDVTTKVGRSNGVRGVFADVVSTPRVAGTKRYVLADPNIAAALVVAFLEGRQAPTIETKDQWETAGTDMRILHDAEAQVFDPRAAVYNAGA